MNTARKIDSSGARQADKFVVRFPEDMRDQIAVVARENHRSMNSEIIARLEYSLRQDNVLNQEQPPIKDGNDLSAHERELLQRFRLLGQRQQNALIALIAQDLDPA